jgi:hypothetical protein
LNTKTRTTITRKDAERFLAAAKRQFAPYITDDNQPKLVEDWDWNSARYSIVWEEGPYDWAVYFPYSGPDMDFGGDFPDASAGLPTHLYAEATTSWAVGLYLSF